MGAKVHRIVLDGLPLQVRSAGIAAYTRALACELARLDSEIEVVLLGLGGPALRLLPGRLRAADEGPLPAALRWWRSAAYPLVMGYPFGAIPNLLALESLAPDIDVFHATNYATPRTRSVPLVVTIHDLTLLRYPHLATRALGRLVGRARRATERARVARCG